MSARAKTTDEAGGWQSKGANEREIILGVVHGAGALNCTWKRTAALLGVHERTLIRWRKDDPAGKIDTAHELGKSEAGKIVMDEMMKRAMAEDVFGSSQVLIHLSKSLCNMSDHSTQTVVTPSDLAGDTADDAAARRAVALDILDLSALDAPGAEQEPEEEKPDEDGSE